MASKTTVRGWVVQIGVAPRHRPYLAVGPCVKPDAASIIGGIYIFPSRKEAREYVDSLDDKADCRIRRATVTLTIED